MNRRDFLFFRTAGTRRIVELSCERLYMRCLDVQLPNAPADEPWIGEPPRVVSGRTMTALFQDLERDLEGVDVLRLVDMRWLASEDLRRQLEAVLGAFRARGGRVEMGDSSREVDV